MKTVLLLPFLSFLTASLTENHLTTSNSIETMKHETLTEISSTNETKIARRKSITSIMTTTEEVFIRKITMPRIQIVFCPKKS